MTSRARSAPSTEAAARHPNHRDPFDRLLVAQALIEDMAIVSKDEILSAYGVTVLW